MTESEKLIKRYIEEGFWTVKQVEEEDAIDQLVETLVDEFNETMSIEDQTVYWKKEVISFIEKSKNGGLK